MKGSLDGISVNRRGKGWNDVRFVLLLFVYVLDLNVLMKELVGGLSAGEIGGLYGRSELAEHGRLGSLMTVDVLCVFRTFSFLVT